MKLMTIVTAGVAALGLAGTSAQATFHFMQIEQVIGGVNGDVTAQAIQLRMRTSGQNLVNNSRIRAHDATGANPIIIATFPSAVPNGATGARVLVTSANFAGHTNIPLVTDRVMTNVIPASYLNAGSLTFEDIFGTVYWRVSWGGAAYTGPTTGDFTNDFDGDFGKLNAPMQTTTLQALKFTGATSAASTANQTDYVLTAGAAVFNNNAGTAFTVIGCPTITVSPATLPSGVVGVAYSETITASGGTAPYDFALALGTLPDGLSLSSAGELSGTPTTPGTSNFTVGATDAGDCSGIRAYALAIDGAAPTGDLDGSGSPDGLDIKHFVECVISGATAGGTCPPGDFNGSGGVNADDVPGFIAALLAA